MVTQDGKERCATVMGYYASSNYVHHLILAHLLRFRLLHRVPSMNAG